MQDANKEEKRCFVVLRFSFFFLRIYCWYTMLLVTAKARKKKYHAMFTQVQQKKMYDIVCLLFIDVKE